MGAAGMTVVDHVTGRPLAPYSGTSDPNLGRDELLDVLIHDIKHQPRTLQTALGPSEVADPCARKIAYKLLGWPEREQDPAWLPYLGTAFHEQAACAFREANRRLRDAGGHDRFLVEHPVSLTTPAGRLIETPGDVTGVQRVLNGHLDLFDVALGEVTDWKLVGANTLKKAKAGKVDAGYKGQGGLYGEGLRQQGHRVDRVRIFFLPRNDMSLVRGSHAWHVDVDDEVLAEGAERTLTRFDNIADGVDQLGPAVLLQLEPVDSNCAWCPFFTPGSQSPLSGCVGPDALRATAAASASRQLDGLIPA